jgi:HEAT repeat protein
MISGVRGKVVEALGEIGDPRAVDPLVLALNDSNPYVKRGAQRR